MRETTVSDQILNSWKEIAQYLNRGVRTVQRWEAELGLPVRRPRGRRRSAVIAMRSEIDQWLERCPLEVREHVEASASAVTPALNQIEARIGSNGRDPGVTDLIVASRLLREDMHRSQKELRAMIDRLVSTIREYRTLTSMREDRKSERVKAFDALENTRVA